MRITSIDDDSNNDLLIDATVPFDPKLISAPENHNETCAGWKGRESKESYGPFASCAHDTRGPPVTTTITGGGK